MSDVLLDIASSLRRSLPAEKSAAAPRASSLQIFCEDDITTDAGAWSIDGHEPFAHILASIDEAIRKPVRDTQISLLKAEQIGATTSLGLAPALHLAADLGRNVGYFLPTDIFARRMGRTRLKRIIAKSEYLSARMKDTDAVSQATIKEFDGKFLYILGLESMMGAISTPLDALFYDEVDMLPAENKEWSAGRIAHSDLRLEVNLSAGYTPGAGIDLLFQEGCQYKFLVDCQNRGCGRKGICLEETFPECIGPNPAPIGDRYDRVCPSCKWNLNVARDGRWVATFPQRAKQRRISYRLSALAVSAMSADYIMNRWAKCRTKSQKAKFRCSVLALPDAGAMQPISDVELNMMQSGEVRRLRQDRGTSPRFAGVDTGDICHFACYERSNGNPELVWIEEIDSDNALERIAKLISTLNVWQLVVDKKPLTTLARALAYRFPRVVALQDFQKESPLKLVDEEHERKPYRCVKVDRDDSLDEMTSELTDRSSFLRIPDVESAPVMATFAAHLKQLRKERSIDAKGRAIDVYVKGVANHFGMALNSAHKAEKISSSAMPFSFTPISAARPREPVVHTFAQRMKKGVLSA